MKRNLKIENNTLSNIFVETILYVHAYLWIGQCLYFQCMIYIVELCLIFLSIIKIGRVNSFVIFLITFPFFPSFFVLSQLSII
jgi:ABC-type transport system involved in cytochrome bd biosynthesis fused ATPase/permease subunit